MVNIVLSIGSKQKRSPYIYLGEIRKVFDNFNNSHPGAKPSQNIINSNTHIPYAWLTAALARLKGNYVAIITFLGHDIDKINFFCKCNLRGDSLIQ